MSKDDYSTWTYADLKAEEKRLFERLELIRGVTNAYEKLLDVKNEYPQGSFLLNSSEKYLIPFKDSLTDLNTHDATVLLLKEIKRPLKTKEILSEFQERDKVMNAKDPMVSLYNGLVGTSQRQGSQIINLGNGTWGLKGRDEGRSFI